MKTKVESDSAFEPMKVGEDEMNWDAYAEHYDVMCELNPSYQDNINQLVSHVGSWDLPPNARICDLGAGTGNYISALAKRLPNAHFVHVDFDTKMNELAQKKYQELGLNRVDIINSYVQNVAFSEGEFDVVICINALYAISPQEEVLRKVHFWLKPEGRFFTIDFGRKQRTIDWTIYLFRESMKRQRVGRYVKVLIENRELIKQNRQTSKGQETGRYWLHSTEEFKSTLENSGFVVDQITPCYRGYCDLAICRKSDPY